MGGATHTPPAPVAAVAASAPPAVPPPPMPAALRVAAAAAASAPPTTGRPLPVERDAAAATTDGAAAAKAAGEPPADAPQLDLAFCCDCTGSMGAYIRSAQDNIRRIAASIFERKGTECSMRFALVKYRDHPPQDKTFVTEVYPFTKSLEVMKVNVDTMAASGGGDGPEAVTAALHEVHELNWREKATKVCVFIADAPPHGLGESGDGFPNGSPDGRDPIAVARSLAAKGITVYTIGVEPMLSTQYRFARDFFMMVASITEGKFLPLGKAEILADVIVSTAIEGMELEQMWGRFENEIRAEAQAKNEQLTEAELCARVESAMASKQAELHVAQVEVDTPYLDTRYDHSNHTALVKAANLAEARSRMSASLNSHVAQETATYAWEKQAMTSNCAAPQQMSTEQMSRASCFAKKKRGLW